MYNFLNIRRQSTMKFLKLLSAVFGLMFATALVAQPVADFNANRTSGCSPLSVQFFDLSTGTPTSYAWAFGNGNNSILQNPSATYIVPGTYTVSLTVTNASGSDVETKVAYITVFTSPIASFTTNNSGGCAPLVVQFTSTSTQGTSAITNWLWDFGDGNISNQTNPSHTYTSSGAKNVSLTVTDANGCSHTTLINSSVNVTQTHNADFTVTNSNVCKPPSTHIFTSTVSPPNAGYTYEWVTSTSQTSTQQNPAFTFNGSGAIGVTLKVTAPSGCATYVTKPRAVFITNIQADFSFPPQPFCAGKTFNFINNTTPDSSINSYTWRLNLGGLVTVKNYSVNLPAGTHNVRLISSQGSCSDTINKTIVVNPNPSALFNLQPGSICKVPTTIAFTSTSTGNGLIHSWAFGNGKFSSLSADTSTYTVLASHNVKLVVNDVNGCKDSLVKAILVNLPNPSVVQLNTKKGCAPYTANFKVSNTTDFISYEWVYNGNVLSRDSAFNYIFNDTGKYVVKLTVVTPDGCTATVYDTVRVGSTVNFDFVADKRSGCFSTINPVKFTLIENSGLDKDFKYTWKWKNGSATDRNPEVNFTDTGSYTITLDIDFNGCLNTLTKPFYINIYPARARLNQPDVNCANDSILFSGNLAYGKNKFLWLFGDGDSSTLKNPKHKYDTSGIFKVKLIVFDTVYNCPDTAQMNVVIPESPKLSFRVKDSVGCLPLRVTLENTSTISPNGYNIINTTWLFSNGQSASGKTAPSTLNTRGWYGLKMTATDARNCIYTLYKDSVAFAVGGNARLSILPVRGCTPLNVAAFDSSITDLKIIQRRWVWTNTDSTTTDTIKSSSYLFTQVNQPQSAGYNVRLTVKDSLGCEFSTSKKVLPSKPKAQIIISRVLSCGSQSITASANTSPNNVLAPANYFWSLGGANINGSTITRSYNQLDTVLNFTLTIIDSNGCVKTADTTIQVNNKKPRVGFYAIPQKLDCYLPIRPIRLFDTTALGAAPVAEWFWRIGINNSNLKNPELTFTKPGKYPVHLTIKDSAGCIDSLGIPDYLVLGGPYGSYTFTPKNGCMPHQSEFTVTSPNAKYFVWDLGDGLVDTMEVNTFKYAYTQPGVYYPRLTLIDSSGTCAYGYDAIDSIVVYALPKPDFVADKRLICYNTTVNLTNTTTNSLKVRNWRWMIGETDTLFDKGPIQKLFTKAGKFTVSLMATDTNGCVDSIIKHDFITVIDDTIPPETPGIYRATVVNNTTTLVEFTKSKAEDIYKYRMFYNYLSNQPFNWVDIFTADDTTFNQQNVNTLINPYTYAVSATDICGNTSDTSYKHTTVELKAQATNNSIAINWTPYVGFDTIKRYEIWRNNADSGNTFVLINTTEAAIRNYIDTSVTCFTTYYYRIKTINQADTTLFSWSDTSGAVPVFVPTVPGTNNIRATVVSDSYILLQWFKRIHKIGFKYAIYRMRDDERIPVFYKETADTFLIDKGVDVDAHSYSYYTYLKDECGGLSSVSNMAKTILLKVDLKENDILKYDPIIVFTPYKDWVDGVSKYQADFYYDSARSFYTISNNAPTDTSFFHKYVNLIQRDYCYKVTGIEKNNENIISESNIACIETKPRLFAPNVFTINGDGLNDKFELGGVFLDEYHLVIYNRWGLQVFESHDIHHSWDGTFEGKPCPADVYVYIAEGVGRKKQHITLNGNVTLLR
jgi:gliding motility-associated-like protein